MRWLAVTGVTDVTQETTPLGLRPVVCLVIEPEEEEGLPRCLAFVADADSSRGPPWAGLCEVGCSAALHQFVHRRTRGKRWVPAKTPKDLDR
ncbi:unnamed protein product [Durusdinium trenchii]|uniref:Uncharacterized protein n=1 Tax=Durusdinium trenchii TaxID=1381693 RepID=A0ABP0N0H0_9DINO